MFQQGGFCLHFTLSQVANKMLDVLRHKTTLVCCYDKPSSNKTFYAANEAGAKMVNYFERWMLEGSWHYYKSIDLFQFMNDWVKELYFNL